MKESDDQAKIETAFVTDRGLNQKRPLNEDSMLSDPAQGIFAVADGVGGAEAGEVASKTAVEVIGEAFRHLTDGADIEDLMELAIQRANSSIHQMSREHPKLSMMATTIVTLHLDGHRATIGHVGDSRLYRLTPDGRLHRETADHSIVEEEVRAGRMTPEQAANHPSKNVISRALGAEPGVEVDLKVLEVEDGTTFLLCTDGITRHIPDGEIRELLNTGQALAAVCSEMKRRCHQRGAEDNLTAVIVRVGAAAGSALEDDFERTLSLELPATAPLSESVLTPASRVAFPATEARAEETRSVSPPPPTKAGRKGGLVRFFVFLLIIGASAGGFYGGMYYQKNQALWGLRLPGAAPTPEATPSPLETDSRPEFERKRSVVDANPRQWISDNFPSGHSNEESANALAAKDPESLYLYGRALMLEGNHRDAITAFEMALSKVGTGANKLSLEDETRIASAAAALRLRDQETALNPQDAKAAEEKAMRALEDAINLKVQTPAP